MTTFSFFFLPEGSPGARNAGRKFPSRLLVFPRVARGRQPPSVKTPKTHYHYLFRYFFFPLTVRQGSSFSPPSPPFFPRGGAIESLLESARRFPLPPWTQKLFSLLLFPPHQFRRLFHPVIFTPGVRPFRRFFWSTFLFFFWSQVRAPLRNPHLFSQRARDFPSFLRRTRSS